MSRNDGQREQERVRAVSDETVNERIDRKTEELVRCYADADPLTLTTRLQELEREWDVERTLEANAATLALVGVVLARVHSRWWLLLPAVVTSFLIQHAVQGWCPPVPLFRRLGIRTRAEVEEERIALKALRGDFVRGVLSADPAQDPHRALEAIRA